MAHLGPPWETHSIFPRWQLFSSMTLTYIHTHAYHTFHAFCNPDTILYHPSTTTATLQCIEKKGLQCNAIDFFVFTLCKAHTDISQSSQLSIDTDTHTNMHLNDNTHTVIVCHDTRICFFGEMAHKPIPTVYPSYLYIHLSRHRWTVPNTQNRPTNHCSRTTSKQYSFLKLFF